MTPRADTHHRNSPANQRALQRPIRVWVATDKVRPPEVLPEVPMEGLAAMEDTWTIPWPKATAGHPRVVAAGRLVEATTAPSMWIWTTHLLLRILPWDLEEGNNSSHLSGPVLMLARTFPIPWTRETLTRVDMAEDPIPALIGNYRRLETHTATRATSRVAPPIPSEEWVTTVHRVEVAMGLQGRSSRCPA